MPRDHLTCHVITAVRDQYPPLPPIPGHTYPSFLDALATTLRTRNFDQCPQISSTQPFDFSRAVGIDDILQQVVPLQDPATPHQNHQIPSDPTRSHQIQPDPATPHQIPSYPIISHHIPPDPTRSHQIPCGHALLRDECTRDACTRDACTMNACARGACTTIRASHVYLLLAGVACLRCASSQHPQHLPSPMPLPEAPTFHSLYPKPLPAPASPCPTPCPQGASCGAVIRVPRQPNPRREFAGGFGEMLSGSDAARAA